MIGDILHPLNRLKAIHPQAAAMQARKYESREHLMAIRIPILDCLWNDVLHLSPLHPARIKEALVETGCLQTPPSRSYYA